jgi:hypothetical protein
LCVPSLGDDFVVEGFFPVVEVDDPDSETVFFEDDFVERDDPEGFTLFVEGSFPFVREEVVSSAASSTFRASFFSSICFFTAAGVGMFI